MTSEERFCSQEEQMQLILDRVWREFSDELGLSEMGVDELLVSTPLDYAIKRGGHWIPRLERWKKFEFVQRNSIAIGRIRDRVTQLCGQDASRTDLREAIWELERLRRERLLFDSKFCSHSARQQIRATDYHGGR